MKEDFTSQLITWFSNVKRDLPWRSTHDPYKIWLSEIILQQTRVDQGLPYYLSFVEHFPSVGTLADATEQEVLKLWEGLGYYSRARNLHSTAKVIARDFNGHFPITYEALIKLKGIGPYTAAAISSIAFKEARPVVDGNVFRFISRYFGIAEDIMKPATRRIFEQVLSELIDKDQPGTFNQAVMEFGATICTPTPKCSNCLLRPGCFAFKQKNQDSLPVKTKKKPVTEVFMDYLVIKNNGRFLMRKRTQAIWNGLYEFLLLEKNSVEFTGVDHFLKEHKLVITRRSETFKHMLSHRKLWVTFYEVGVPDGGQFQKIAQRYNLTFFTEEEMVNLPHPKIIVNYLRGTVN